MVEQARSPPWGGSCPSYVSGLSGPAPDATTARGVRRHRARQLAARASGGEADERAILQLESRAGDGQTVCQVYDKVGGHAYGSVYGGTDGAVLTPLLEKNLKAARAQAAVTLVGS